MVVVCESCSTRFRVDEARIPPKGTLVRCSRCKATFIVQAPHASFDETIQDVVAEVTEAGGQPVPAASEDLFDQPSDDLGATGTQRGSDDAWEFDEEPAHEPPPPELARFEAEPSPPEPAPPLEEIGRPEEWDLLGGDSVRAVAKQASFIEPREPEPAADASVEDGPHAPSSALPAHFSGRRAADLGRQAANVGLGAARAAAWLALAGLVSIGIARVLPDGPALVAPKPAPAVIALADGEARGVEVRFVENAFAGTLFVVEGELARGSAAPGLGLRVHWVDASGAALGAGTWAGAKPSTRALRERAPEALLAELEAAPEPAPLVGRFAAIFDAVPEAAAGVGLSLAPLPLAPLPPEAGAGAGEDEATSARADATASSPPSPPPSSE